MPSLAMAPTRLPAPWRGRRRRRRRRGPPPASALLTLLSCWWYLASAGEGGIGGGAVALCCAVGGARAGGQALPRRWERRRRFGSAASSVPRAGSAGLGAGVEGAGGDPSPTSPTSSAAASPDHGGDVDAAVNTGIEFSEEASADDSAAGVEVKVEASGESVSQDFDSVGMWPCLDEMDRDLVKIALPCIANFAINPLIGAVDLFWVNRMSNALAVAGQAAANQVFSSAFWLSSFLPSVTATLVAKANADGDQEEVQDAVCQALVVGFVVALVGWALIFLQPERVLSAVLQDGAPALEFARPYLLIRSFAFLPNLTSLIGYSAFRGVLDTVTPMKISLFANVFNAILDPILIFPLGLGVAGAALATLAAEVISAVTFMKLLLKRRMIRWSKLLRIPQWSKLEPLLKGGLALQLRNFALNLTFLGVTRVTQSIDDTGVAAAAHALAIQTFQLGGIVLLGLSTVAQTVIPNEMIEKTDPVTGKKSGGALAAKAVVNRLMSWGFILGGVLGALQIAVLPFLLRSSPLEEVREAARVPSYLASVYQLINGLVFIGEGVMVGTGSFLQLSLSTLVATLATLQALRALPARFGITGVWMSFGVFNMLRLSGVWLHQSRNGPLAPRNLGKKIQ